MLVIGDSGNDSISTTDGDIVGRLTEANKLNISGTFRSKHRLLRMTEKDKNNGNLDSQEHQTNGRDNRLTKRHGISERC